MTESPNRRYVPEIDQLRCFAALLVLFYHGFYLIGAQLAHGVPFDASRDWIRATNPLIAVIGEGHSGVAMFIVLSGFVLSLGTVGQRIIYGRFLLARFLRLYPLLILFSVAAFTVDRGDVSRLVVSLLPINAADILPGNFTAMFWAVSVEFECYLVFPFLIRFSGEKGTRMLVQVIAVALTLRILAVLSEGANAQQISYWTVLGRIDQFCIGMIAARLYLLRGWRERTRPWMVVPAATAVVTLLWLFNHVGGWPANGAWKLLWPDVEGAVWAMFILAYLSAGTRLPAPIAAPLTWIGRISYSVYMVHYVVLNVGIRNSFFLRVTGVPYYDALLTTALVALPISLLIGSLLFETVELPFLRLRPRYVDNPPQSVIARTGIGRGRESRS
jgi:peptidoglycan/LPS O-acetylase OafA/YrhL